MNEDSRPQTFKWIIVLTVFATSGLFVGYLVGASSTPVVAALLPLLFGVFGAFSLQYFEQRSRNEKLLARIDKLEVDDPTKNVIKAHLDIDYRSDWIPALWGIGVLLFCGTCVLGLNWGIGHRLGDQRDLGEILTSAKIDSTKITTSQYVDLHNLVLRLRSHNASREMTDAVFQDIIKRAIEVDGDRGHNRHLNVVANDLFNGLTTEGQAKPWLPFGGTPPLDDPTSQPNPILDDAKP